MTDEKPDLQAVWEALGGRVLQQKFYGWNRALCPLHDDRDSSAQVNTEKQTFRCMVCNLYGDVYQLVMTKEGIRFRDAKRRAEELAGGVGHEVRGVAQRPGSLLPGRQGDRRDRRAYLPPWRVRGTGGRA